MTTTLMGSSCFRSRCISPGSDETHSRQPCLAREWAALVLIALSLAVWLAGTFGAELFLTRVSLIGVIAGTVLVPVGPAALPHPGYSPSSSFS